MRIGFVLFAFMVCRISAWQTVDADKFPTRLKTYLELSPRQQESILKLNQEFDRMAAEDRREAEEAGRGSEAADKIREHLAAVQRKISSVMTDPQRAALAALEKPDAPAELAGQARQMRMLAGSSPSRKGHFTGPTTIDKSYTTIPPETKRKQ